MSTNRYVIDSWAWIEYLDGTNAGRKVKEAFEKGQVYTNIVSIAEVISKVDRRGKDPNVALEAITTKSKMIVGSAQFARDVGLLHSKIKKSRPNFSLADAFTLQTAVSMNAKVMTGDPDFKGLKDAIVLTK